jgi:hypothetical protein
MSIHAATPSATTALAGARSCVYVPMSDGVVSGTTGHVAFIPAFRAWLVNAKRHSRRPEEVASQP